MTRRTEFSRKIKAAVHLRANGRCESDGCGAKLKKGEGEVDHVQADALGGEATLDNARLLCRVCHAAKSANDVRAVRKADRARDRQSGALKSKRPLRSRNDLRKRDKASVRAALPALPPRPLYVERTS